MPLMLVAPRAIAAARDTSAAPRSTCGDFRGRASAGRWDRYLGHEISDVQLHYRPWAPDDGYWCSRVTITVRGSDIQFLGGQAEAQTLAPSADNIAVLFPPAPLPEWERYDDGI